MQKDVSHIRSFVIRQTRMSEYQRRSFETLYQGYSLLCDDEKSTRKQILSAFPGCDRLVAEIGFGMGEATLELAEKFPETAFLGIEVHKPGIGKLLGELASRSITNVRVIREDAMVVFERMLAPAVLDGVHVFFPDPWPKKRHHKRRLVRHGFTAMVGRALRPGAYAYLTTDVRDYAEHMLEVIGTDDEFFENPSGGFCEPLSWRPRTAFERKGLARSHEIFEIFLKRR
ncbi:MAG: tRNA (guanosine(46)-N7)-methyltransferase TrmB [Spirochaetaceae bacterium]|nr:MAG: tRNA (guanosine(46)-N7)-methyltransferase TrmB [Spirochaetaceae bacterium]